MAKRKGASHEGKIAAAAQLAAQGLDQAAIGRRLGISQAGVSRLLCKAEDKRRKWLVRSPLYRKDRVPLHIHEAAKQEIFTHDLDKDFRRVLGDIPLREVLVFDSGGTGTSEEEYVARLSTFGRAAATRVVQLFRHVDVVGISWGRTLLHVIRGLGNVHRSSRGQEKPIEFVPLCCEPLGNASVEVSSSRLASQLNQIVNGGKAHVHSFTGVPAFIPKGFKRSERATIERLNRCVSSYAKVFPPVYSKPHPVRKRKGQYLVDKLQLVLTSLAPADRLLGYSEDKLAETGFSRTKLQTLAVGDICGTLIERPGLTRAQKAMIAECNNSWTGATLAQLQNVPSLTDENGTGGLVVLAVGRAKAPIVIEAVKLGAHELLIDGDLASGLKEALAKA